MKEITTIGVDLAKSVFTVHGMDAAGPTVLRKTVRRERLMELIAGLPPCLVGMEACGGAHELPLCTDWRSGVRRFHVGTGHHEPTSDAGYTTAGSPFLPQLSISLFLCRGSPYTRA